MTNVWWVAQHAELVFIAKYFLNIFYNIMLSSFPSSDWLFSYFFAFSCLIRVSSFLQNYLALLSPSFSVGTCHGAVDWGTTIQARRSWVWFPMVSLEFLIYLILRPHLGLGVDSATNRHEYQECFLGGKGGRCVGLTTLPHSCAHCLEIWEPLPPGILKAYKDCSTFIRQCFCDIYCSHSWYKVSMRLG